jgi:pimeloyl-ACP methyl ester carboxylesterase
MTEVIQGRRIEYQYHPSGKRRVMVFLHEGLGSVTMWKDFPVRCAQAAGCDALVYSRYGHGQSDPVSAPRRPDYMHEEALSSLPELLRKLGIARPVLFGHSDGASIALIHAGAHPVAGVVVLAPHVFVEEIALASIRAIRQTYDSGDLRDRLARYHADPDSTFRAWNDIWLHPDFRPWDIRNSVGKIQAPVLAIQGNDDEYGTMLQLDIIAQLVPGAKLLKLDRCRHSPHRDQPDAVIAATSQFVTCLNTPLANKPNGKETGSPEAT